MSIFVTSQLQRELEETFPQMMEAVAEWTATVRNYGDIPTWQWRRRRVARRLEHLANQRVLRLARLQNHLGDMLKISMAADVRKDDHAHHHGH